MHTDRLGSVIATTNTNGTQAASVAYNAWGVKRSSTGNVGPLGFTGEYTDPVTGFVYLRARWYDPATAEFITRDPAESQTGDPYSYAANSPLAFTDPLGLWPSWEDVTSAVSGAGDWVVENRHSIIDVATTVGTVVAIGAVCGVTAGVGCVAAVAVGAAAAGTIAHKGADALVNDDGNDISWGGAAGRSAVNAAVGATCAFTFGQGCSTATLGLGNGVGRQSIPFAARWAFRTPAAAEAGRLAAGAVWGSTSLLRWLTFTGAGWRCHGGLGVG
jgi:RHS repeat-associated protein